MCDRATVLRDGRAVDRARARRLQRAGDRRAMVGRQHRPPLPRSASRRTRRGTSAPRCAAARATGRGRCDIVRDVVFDAAPRRDPRHRRPRRLRPDRAAERDLRPPHARGHDQRRRQAARRRSPARRAPRRASRMLTEDRKQRRPAVQLRPRAEHHDRQPRRGSRRWASSTAAPSSASRASSSPRCSIKARPASAATSPTSAAATSRRSCSRGAHERARVMLLDEPTKGVDVETRQEIYRLIVELADRGSRCWSSPPRSPSSSASATAASCSPTAHRRRVRPRRGQRAAGRRDQRPCRRLARGPRAGAGHGVRRARVAATQSVDARDRARSNPGPTCSRRPRSWWPTADPSTERRFAHPSPSGSPAPPPARCGWCSMATVTLGKRTAPPFVWRLRLGGGRHELKARLDGGPTLDVDVHRRRPSRGRPETARNAGLVRRGADVFVRTSAALTTALATARPGQTISLADGTYTGSTRVGEYTGSFVVTRSGTPSRPITLYRQPRRAARRRRARRPLRAVRGGCLVVALPASPVAHASKGAVSDGGSHDVYAGLAIRDIGAEGLHLRASAGQPGHRLPDRGHRAPPGTVRRGRVRGLGQQQLVDLLRRQARPLRWEPDRGQRHPRHRCR